MTLAILFSQWFTAAERGLDAYRAKLASMGARPAPAMGAATLDLFPDGSTAVTHWQGDRHFARVTPVKVVVP